MNNYTYDDIELSQEGGGAGPRELIPRGACKAVCVDVVDEGLKPNNFKQDESGNPLMQRHIRIYLETSRMRSNGKPFTISKSFNAKIYDGSKGGRASTLYGFLASWIGPDWDGRFSSKLVIGRPAELFIEHERGTKDKTQIFPKILAIHPLDEEFKPSGNYKRYTPKPKDDEEVPF